MRTTLPDQILRCLRAVLPAALLLLLATPAPAQIVYPRLGLYGSVREGGVPYVDSTGALDPVTIAGAARYDELILEASPITEYRPDVLAAMRALNPKLKALAYVVGHNIWFAEDPDSLVHYPTRYNHLVRNLDGYLYNRSGGYYTGQGRFGITLCRVNLAKRDGSGRFVVAEGLVDLWYDAIVKTGLWDGLFLDVYCDEIGWSQSPAESIDVVRAGYPDTPSFDAAWHAATDTMAARLRRRCGPDFILVGNCASGTHYADFNGWMREDFPHQQGGDWYTNMFRTTGGYFVDEVSFRAPTHNYIYTAAQGSAAYTAENARRVRFGLASASLASGFGAFGGVDRNIEMVPYFDWWYDEYAVDLVTGRASGLRKDTGWLGAARGSWYQMIWAGNGADAVTNAGFEGGVTDGWTFWHEASLPASVDQDATTAATGSASAHVHVPFASFQDWHIALTSVGTLWLQQGRSYSATFWAKASKPRRITVAASVPGTSYALRVVEVGTEWRQYQVILIPIASATASLAFALAADDGDVWLDDVHLQAGATNLYRRDFENGIVLVNPAAQSLTVPLQSPFRRILGTVDPVVNDGSLVTEVTVPPSDAIFLIGGDLSPPTPIRDLRLVR
jgi:hypothetical protein